MNDRQKRFADEYLIDLNAEAAAIRAGYSSRSVRKESILKAITGISARTFSSSMWTIIQITASKRKNCWT